MADTKISALTAATTPLAGTEVAPIVQSGTTVKAAVTSFTNGIALTPSSVTLATGNLVLNGGITSDVALIKNTGQSFGVATDRWIGSDGTTSTWFYNVPTGGSHFFAVNNVNKMTVVGDNVNISVGNLVIGTNGKGIDFSADPSAAGMTSELLDDYEEGTWTPVLARASGGPITATTSDVTAKYTKVGNLVTVSLFLIITGVTSQGSGENEIRGLPFAPADNSVGAGSVGRNSTFTTDVVHNCWVWSDSRIIFSSNVNSLGATAVDWKDGYMNLTMTYFV
jgi:hypothetical protein